MWILTTLRRSIPVLLICAVLLGTLTVQAEQSGASTVHSYGNLPLECNAVVSNVSTYDKTYVGGRWIYHGQALDFPAPSGMKVVAPAAGVAYVRYGGGYGNYVDVVEPNGKTHRMAHLQGGGLINNGARIQKGRVVGLVGNTGASTGPHLHYEQRVGGVAVSIQLEGPSLVWGPKLTADGDRNTTHGLKSANCIGTSRAVDSRVDIAGWSSNSSIRIGRSNGSVASGWKSAVPMVSNPTHSDACNFNGVGATEYISYEANLKQFVMGSPRGDGSMSWSVILSGIYNISDFVCLDWNKDGNSDIWARDSSNNAIYVGYSNGTRITKWVRQKALNGSWARIGNMEFLERCDLNGDGRAEVIAYEANRRFMVGRPSTGNRLRWDMLLNNVYNIDATACGNFNPKHKGQELIGWQIYKGKGTFVIGEFDSRFRHQRWDPISPNGIGRPHRGELDAGDLDRDGVSELFSHEFRNNSHYVMVADFTSSRAFRWYQYLGRINIEDMHAGHFH